MPCEKCGHKVEDCDACQGIGDSQHTRFDSYSAEHRKHVEECNPDVPLVIRGTGPHPK
jgi:hypothetical protein